MIRIDIEPDAPSGVAQNSPDDVARSLLEAVDRLAAAIDDDRVVVAGRLVDAVMRRAAFERLKQRYDVRRLRSKS